MGSYEWYTEEAKRCRTTADEMREVADYYCQRAKALEDAAALVAEPE